MTAAPSIEQVIAAVPDWVGRIVTAEEFRAFVAGRPAVAVALIRMLMGRLREGDRRRVEFGAYDATTRVARLLCDLAADVRQRVAGVRVTVDDVDVAAHQVDQRQGDRAAHRVPGLACRDVLGCDADVHHAPVTQRQARRTALRCSLACSRSSARS